MQDANVLDGNVIAGKNRGKCGNAAGFINKVAVQYKIGTDRTIGAVRNRVPVIPRFLKKVQNRFFVLVMNGLLHILKGSNVGIQSLLDRS